MFLREPTVRPHVPGVLRAAAVMEIDVGSGAERLVRRIHLIRHGWSPEGRRLAFIGGRRSALFALELGTGHLRRLLPNATSLAWSPSGRRLVAVGSIRARRGLIVADASGKARPHLVIPAKSRRWIWGWSPNGEAIAYGFTITPRDQDNQNGRQGLAVVDASGTKRPVLVASAEAIMAIEWSPDGSKFAYVRIDGKYSCCDIYVVNRDGSNDHRVVDGADYAQALNPTWSPDGRLIAYTSLGQGGNGLHVVAADGTGDRVLAGRGFQHPTWSPDGSLIAGTRGTLEEPGIERTLVVARADGGGERTVATNATGPFWSPDRRRIAYVGGPIWSPDSHTIAYLGADADGVHLHRVEVDGTSSRQLTYGPVSDTWPQWRARRVRKVVIARSSSWFAP